MSEPEKPERPVVDGVVALVAVALAVGLIMGGAVLFGAKVFGFGDDGDSSADSTQRQSMSLPPLEKTTAAKGPAITLNTAEPSHSSSTESSEPSDDASSKKPKKGQISLQANPLEVGNFEKIYLTGTYAEEGAVLQVQVYRDKTWLDFAATTSVSGGTFSTYIQTGYNGVNTFRMIVKSTGVTSNEVKVTVNP